MVILVVTCVLLALAIFMGGLVCGAWFVMYGHKQGVKLVDRIKHDMVPYEDSEIGEEKEIQTYTDGTMEEVE